MLGFIILGFPLLSRQTAPFILFSTVGIIIETIIAMAFYTRIIEKKYRKKKVTVPSVGKRERIKRLVISRGRG